MNLVSLILRIAGVGMAEGLHVFCISIDDSSSLKAYIGVCVVGFESFRQTNIFLKN